MGLTVDVVNAACTGARDADGIGIMASKTPSVKDKVPARLEVPLEVAEQFVSDLPLGAFYTARETLFRVFAPRATLVEVVLYEEARGDVGRLATVMEDVGSGVWEARIKGDLEGKFYVWRFIGNAGRPDVEVIDIYATNAVDSSRRGRITDFKKTNPAGWRESGKVGPVLKAPTDAVLYELHVRDLTMSETSGVKQKGKYLGWTEPGTNMPGEDAVSTALDHIVELGVTHVQILPVQDYEWDEKKGDYFWGYMTSCFNSPEGIYASDIYDESRVKELKALIAALHERGLGVILDVVYNHTADHASFDAHVPGYYYRLHGDGSKSNGSGVGNDFRSEIPMARKFIVDSLKFWVEEYGVDGFRFDLMSLVDLETMQMAESELLKIRRDLLIYGEPWSAGDSALHGRWTDKGSLEETEGIGAFNDDFRNVIKGPPDGDEVGFIQAGYSRDALIEGLKGTPAWAPKPGQTINYMTCHDNMVLWDKLKASSRNISDEGHVQMAKLGYLILMVSQGIPFLHGGDEFGRTKHGDHNSYRSPDSTNQIDWSLKKKNWGLYNFVRDLIALRKAHPVFRLRTKAEVEGRFALRPHPWYDTVCFTIDGEGLEGETWNQVCVMINGSQHMTGTFQLPVGKWKRASDGMRVASQGRSWEGAVQVPKRTGMIFWR